MKTVPRILPSWCVRCVAGREELTVHGLGFLSSTVEDGHCRASESGRTLECSGSLRSEKLVLEGRPRVVSAPRPLRAAWHSCEEAGTMVMSPVWLQGQRGRSEDAEQGVGVRLLMALLGGSGTAWPAHKLFTTNNTDPDELYLGTLHGATARRMRGCGMGRLGDLEVGMPPSCPRPQGMSMLCSSSVTSSESLPQGASGYCFRPDAAPASLAPLLSVLLQVDAS